MNKIVLSTALLSILATSSLLAQESDAPLLSQGTRELALNGTIELPEFEEVDFDIDASFGYFIRDGWEVGVRALGADIGGIERFSFSGFTEYNFNRDSNTVPYLGVAVGLADVNFENLEFDSTLRPNDGDSTVFGIQAGIKWFIRPYMAISTSISFDASSDDIYLTDDSLKDNLTRIRIGLRYYF